MSKIAMLTDVLEEGTVEDDWLLFSVTKKALVWYLKVTMPDGDKKYYRYADGASGNQSSSAENKRREIIQTRINELSEKGFSVNQKYISLFISKKIKELIIEEKSAQRRNRRR